MPPTARLCNYARLIPRGEGTAPRAKVDWSAPFQPCRELFPQPRYHAAMHPNKPVHAENIPTPTERLRRQVPHEEIAQRAEKLWRERSCPAGSDEAIWLEAESQLKAEAESQPVSGTASRPYVDEPAAQLRPRTKTQDPADSAAQTRSATDKKSRQTAGKLRNQ